MVTPNTYFKQLNTWGTAFRVLILNFEYFLPLAIESGGKYTEFVHKAEV